MFEMNICAVIVLYKCKVDDSKTINSLLINYENNTSSFDFFKLVIYDNGPDEQTIDKALPFDFEYFHNPKNEGLAVAYNFALKKALDKSYDWLLLLDQDSALPHNFISDLFHELKKNSEDTAITAVVPKMRYHNFFFSPSILLLGGISRPIDMHFVGICPDNTFAIGSGSLVKVPFLQQIGGFNEFFWIDFLDRWLYMKIRKSGGRVYVADIIIDHELSILNFDKYMNEKRYANIIMYETYYMKFYESKIDNFVYNLRLVRRIIVFGLSKSTRKYSMLTFSLLKDIVFSKKYSKNRMLKKSEN